MPQTKDKVTLNYFPHWLMTTLFNQMILNNPLFSSKKVKWLKQTAHQ